MANSHAETFFREQTSKTLYDVYTLLPFIPFV